MKTTFEKAKDRVNEMAAGYHDETLPLAGMEFRDLETMEIAGEPVEVLPSAQRLFANRLRVPLSYLSRCSRELQARNLNYWLEVEKSQRETLFCRFDSYKLRAVFTDRYKALDNREVMAKMDDHGFRPETEIHLTLNQNFMVVKVPDYARTFAVRGDEMTPGIAVSNSEVGVMAFSVEAYFYRLVCTNGLIARTEVSSKFRHVSYKALEEFHALIGQVIEESRHNQERLFITLEKAVDDPEATLESFNRQFKLTKSEGEAVEAAWRTEPGSTLWSIINAYTRAGQNGELAAEERDRLERVGGEILALTK
jgi:hypothetical protein